VSTPEIPGAPPELIASLVDQIRKLPPEQLAILKADNERKRARQLAERKLFSLYPDTGALRRELYTKHLMFFRAGGKHSPMVNCPKDCDGSGHTERAAIGSNRSGKSTCTLYELTCHLIGWYPKWWEGRRFIRPINAWAAGEDVKAIRESLQVILLGNPGDFGTGLIPKTNLISTTPRAGVPEAIDAVTTKHSAGGSSRLLFKCFARNTAIKMGDGSLKKVQDIELWDRVLCADGIPRNVTALHSYADSPLLLIETSCGPTTMTPNHLVYVEGEKSPRAAETLKAGDVLQIACPDHPIPTMQEDWRVKLTALMIGDGCTRGKTPFFTCAEPNIVEWTKDCLPPDMYIVPIKSKKRGKPISFKISSKNHKFNRLKESLENDRLWGVLSKQKHIPKWVFQLPLDQKKIFIRWLYGCDGTIRFNTASYTTASGVLANDLRLLLWDVGIPTKVRHHYVKLKGKAFLSYYLSLTGENRIKFQEIGKLNRTPGCMTKPNPRNKYGEVLAIKKVSNGPSYCVTVDETHELIADGFRSGNSYDQGRESFQAAKIDIFLCDEEPPQDIYSEGLTRTMSTVPGEESGIVMCGFTPLKGLSNVVLSYLPGGKPMGAS
jgi:phage terminase large subunit-like protein